MDPSPPSSQCSPLKLGSIMKLTIKIHQKCQKLAFLLPFVLDLGRFVGVVQKFSRASRAIIISSSPPPLQNVYIRPCKGLSVGCLTRESSDSERAMALSGQYQLVLFSPEALLIVRRWREMLQSEVYKSRIVAFVVDEAHCVNSYKIYCEL